MKIEPIKLSRVRKSVGRRQERTNKQANQWRTTTEKKWNKKEIELYSTNKINETEREHLPVASTCLGLRVETMFYHFLSWHSVCLWVPYVALDSTVCLRVSVCVFPVFIIPTDWLLQLFHYPIHSFSCRLDVYSSFWYLRLFEMFLTFLLFMFVRIIQGIETRMTTNMFVEFWAKATCVRTPETERIFSVVPFFEHLIPLVRCISAYKKFLLPNQKWWHWRSRKDDRLTKTKHREDNRQNVLRKWVNGIDILLQQNRKKYHSNNSNSNNTHTAIRLHRVVCAKCNSLALELRVNYITVSVY